MTITITAADALQNLHSAAGHHPRCCPVARALRAATGAGFVTVDTQRLRVDDVTCATPPVVAAWLKVYDARRDPGSLSFAWEMAPESP